MADQNTILHPIEAGRVQEDINLYPKTTIGQVLELNDTLDDKQDKFAEVSVTGSGDNKTATITSVEHNLIIVGDVPEESEGGDITIRTDHGGEIHFNSTDVSLIDMDTDGISLSGPALVVNTGDVDITSSSDIGLSAPDGVSISSSGDIGLGGSALNVDVGDVNISSGTDISLGAPDGVSISTGGDIDLTPAGQALYNNKEIAIKEDTQPKEYEFTIAIDTSSSSTLYDTQIHLNPARPLYIQIVECPEMMIGFQNAISYNPFPTAVDDIIIVFFSKLGGWVVSQFQSSDMNLAMWLDSVDLTKTFKLYFNNYSSEPDPDSITVKIIN